MCELAKNIKQWTSFITQIVEAEQATLLLCISNLFILGAFYMDLG